MIKETIRLEAIDPIEIYGAANRNLEALCSYFPELKVAARGNDIFLEGKKEDVEKFTSKLTMLIERRKHKMSITPYDVEDIFDGESTPDRFKLCGDAIIVHGNDGKPIKARNRTQEEMVRAYFENDLIFALGPAGTGKTYIAIALAVRALKNREIKRIILTRPAVEAGERLGFLPGDLKDKLDPYLQPLYDALGDMIPAKRLQEFMAEGTIQIAPLAYMRGRTLESAFVILDEAQNTSREQMKMFLTRLGFGSKIVITGDITQIDLPDDKTSGLKDAVRVLDGIKDIAICRLTAADVVRHALVQEIINAYEKASEKPDFKKSNPNFKGKYKRKI